MGDMSPLGRLILRLMRVGAMGAAGFTLFAMALEAWRRWQGGGLSGLTPADYRFFAVLVAMLAAALWLARAIARELDKPGG